VSSVQLSLLHRPYPAVGQTPKVTVAALAKNKKQKDQHEQRAIASTETHRSKVHTLEYFLMGVPTAQWWNQLHYTVMARLEACMVWISEKAVREKTTTTTAER